MSITSTPPFYQIKEEFAMDENFLVTMSVTDLQDLMRYKSAVIMLSAYCQTAKFPSEVVIRAMLRVAMHPEEVEDECGLPFVTVGKEENPDDLSVDG